MIAEPIPQRPTLGALIEALDETTENLLAAAKRAPKVRPNGTLRSAIDRMRATQDDLSTAAGRKRGR